MSVASNPYVPDGDLPWPEYDQPDMVTTMILMRKFKKALEAVSKVDPDSEAGRIARAALFAEPDAQTQQHLGQGHVNRGHGDKPGEKSDYSPDLEIGK